MPNDNNAELVRSIVAWDTVNWSRALDFWEAHSPVTDGGLECLELGGRKGGLSLWLALHGNTVVCSDFGPRPDELGALELHREHNVAHRIEYRSINALDIGERQAYDLVIFKSLLGGVSREGNDLLKQQVIDQIHLSLKPGGSLLFAENLAASSLHAFARKHFVKWGQDWNYLKYGQLSSLFASFEQVEYQTAGFLAAFGRTEPQRRLLGKMDSVFHPIIPGRMRYIVYGAAKKAGGREVQE